MIGICVKAYSIFQCIQNFLKMNSSKNIVRKLIYLEKSLGEKNVQKKKHEITRISWERKKNRKINLLPEEKKIKRSRYLEIYVYAEKENELILRKQSWH